MSSTSAAAKIDATRWIRKSTMQSRHAPVRVLRTYKVIYTRFYPVVQTPSVDVQGAVGRITAFQTHECAAQTPRLMAECHPCAREEFSQTPRLRSLDFAFEFALFLGGPVPCVKSGHAARGEFHANNTHHPFIRQKILLKVARGLGSISRECHHSLRGWPMDFVRDQEPRSDRVSRGMVSAAHGIEWCSSAARHGWNA